MTQPKDVRIEVKVRNNLILTRMEEKKITTVSELCRQMGVPGQQSHIGQIINMKLAARKENGDWLPMVQRLADFFQCMPDDLFSEPQQWDKLEKNRAHAEVTYVEMQQLTARRRESVTPEVEMQAAQLRQAITRVLSMLTPREERVLRLRFGFEGEELTLEQIGEQFGITKERIREIEAKALRKLKHPSRARIIAQAGGSIIRRNSPWGPYTSYVVDEDVKEAL